MPSLKLSAAQAIARINTTNVQIEGAWMPCEYVLNRDGQVAVVMLADIEFDEPASRTAWHASVDDAARYRFASIEPCRKLAVRQTVSGRSIDDCPFRQFLKRDLAAHAQ